MRAICMHGIVSGLESAQLVPYRDRAGLVRQAHRTLTQTARPDAGFLV